jgi:hypothetical protein
LPLSWDGRPIWPFAKGCLLTHAEFLTQNCWAITSGRLAVLAVIFAIAAVAIADPPAAPPHGDSAPFDVKLTPRQQSLLMQLSDAEANIQAINKALIRTGYKVGVAYDRIDSNLKGNELMDRKGGGPVRWDEFYGRTARDFVMHDAGSPVYHQVQRPSEFDFIYRANDNQISRAKDQIASLEKNQSALLARREKHEADQARLWATIAFEQGDSDTGSQLDSIDAILLAPRRHSASNFPPPTLASPPSRWLYPAFGVRRRRDEGRQRRWA